MTTVWGWNPLKAVSGNPNPTVFAGEVTVGSMDKSGNETEESKVRKGNGVVYV